MSSLIVEVVRINSLDKHPNADTLQIAQVKGWNCIVKEGQFKVGDLAIYVPIDAVLPEWVIKHYDMAYLKKGERVQTVKLRGFISHGLLLTLPTVVISENGRVECGPFREGKDVAKELGITKWEPPTPEYQKAGQPAKRNDNFRKYNEIENIKNYNRVFADGEEVVITEKIHGTSARYGTVEKVYPPTLRGRLRRWWDKLTGNKFEYAVGSRNVQLKDDNSQKFYKDMGKNIYVKIGKDWRLDEILPPGYILFGEIYGEGIQDLTYGLKGIKFRAYDLMVDGEYICYEGFRDFCLEKGIPMVPVLYIGPYSLDVLAQHTTGMSTLCDTQIREGCVVKSRFEAASLQIGRKVLKSISPAYDLRKNGTESQ